MKLSARHIVIPVVMVLGVAFFMAVPAFENTPQEFGTKTANGNESTQKRPDLKWPRDEIVIKTPPDFEARELTVEMAVTPRQRQVGLMFRESMPEDRGMLFIFEEEEHQAFWMKNTYIPLDMVFIDSTGRVVHVHENAKPEDETVIHSQKPAMAVLEVNAGMAKPLGLVPGSQIDHAAFSADNGN